MDQYVIVNLLPNMMILSLYDAFFSVKTLGSTLSNSASGLFAAKTSTLLVLYIFYFKIYMHVILNGSEENGGEQSIIFSAYQNTNSYQTTKYRVPTRP